MQLGLLCVEIIEYNFGEGIHDLKKNYKDIQLHKSIIILATKII